MHTTTADTPNKDMHSISGNANSHRSVDIAPHDRQCCLDAQRIRHGVLVPVKIYSLIKGTVEHDCMHILTYT